MSENLSLNQEYLIDLDVFNTHFKKASLSNSKLEHEIGKISKDARLTDTSIHRIRNGEKTKIKWKHALALAELFNIPPQILVRDEDLKIVSVVCEKCQTGKDLMKLCLDADVINFETIIEPSSKRQRDAVFNLMHMAEKLKSRKHKRKKIGKLKALKIQYELRDAIDELCAIRHEPSGDQLAVYVGTSYQLLAAKTNKITQTLHFTLFDPSLYNSYEDLDPVHDTYSYAKVLHLVIDDADQSECVTTCNIDPFSISSDQSPILIEYIHRVKHGLGALYTYPDDTDVLSLENFSSEVARKMIKDSGRLRFK